MATLKRNLLLLSEDLDLGGGKAKRGVGNRGCYGHLVPAETCSYRDKSLGSAGRSQCVEMGWTEFHDGWPERMSGGIRTESGKESKGLNRLRSMIRSSLLLALAFTHSPLWK